MGLYATTTSISKRLPDFLANNTTTADSGATHVFSEYIDHAEAKFNAAVANRYSLPFSTIPPLARHISFDMAAYYVIRAFGSRDWPNRNEWLEDFGRSFDLLEQIRSGEVPLTATDGSLIGTRSSGRYLSNREGEHSVFDVDDPTTWDVDQDRLDTIESERD